MQYFPANVNISLEVSVGDNRDKNQLSCSQLYFSATEVLLNALSDFLTFTKYRDEWKRGIIKPAAALLYMLLL